MNSAAPTNERSARRPGRRIVLTTFGSLGDLHPYIALALALQARGHEAIIATTRHYQQRIVARGIGFHAVRPDGPDLDADRDAMRRIMDTRKGTEFVVRELLMPVLWQSYEDLLTATDGADLLVSHVLTYAARLVAEKRRIPWASIFLQPLGFFSAYDPPVLPQVPFLSKLRFLGPAFHRPLLWLAKRSCRSWADPWHRLRAEIQLPPTSENPLFECLYSPSLILAMFSKLFADKQPDWPTQTIVSGFPFSGQGDQGGMSPELVRFLDSGAATHRVHARLVGGHGRWTVFRAQCRRGQTARPTISAHPRRRPRKHARIPAGRSHRVRLCPVLGSFSTSRRDRPRWRHRDDGPGDAFRSSHAGHALRPRPVRQRRAGCPPRNRQDDFSAPIPTEPCRG